MSAPAPAEVLNRFLIRILRDLPPVADRVVATGQAGGRTVEITATPEGWTPRLHAPPVLSPSERRIMDTVRAAERPLTGYGIWGVLRAQGKNYSLHTIYRSLARLRADGLLHNDRDGSGYIAVD